MDASKLLVIACCLSAFFCAAAFCVSACEIARSRSRAVRLQQHAGQQMNVRFLQTGMHGLNRVAEKLLGAKGVRRYCQSACFALSQKHIDARPVGVLSSLLVVCIALGIVCLLCGRLALAPFAMAAAVCMVGVYSSKAADVHLRQMRTHLPDALQSMSSCFGAGYTLIQTFSHLENELPGPLGQLFGNAAQALQVGTPPATVLEHMRQEGGMNELSFVSVALSVQHQTGGSMQHVLDATRASLKEEIELRQSLQVHTAQAKLSARVVVGVTIGLVGAMMLISPDFLAPFFYSFAGLCMLLLAVLMQLGGIISVRRLLNVGLE